MDARCAPPWILCFHAPDQFADFADHLWSPGLPGSPPPKQTKAGTMPGHNGFRFNDDENISPAGMYAPQRRPKEPVHASEPGSRLLSLENDELLPQSSGFQCEPVARHEECTDVREDRNGERTHRSDSSRAAFDARHEPGSIRRFCNRSGFDDPHVIIASSCATSSTVIAFVACSLEARSVYLTVPPEPPLYTPFIAFLRFFLGLPVDAL